MAFTFNWTPLTAPTSSPEFYSHAKELLTTALNSSSNSSTILNSDIVVEDLNLGQNAPEIEVLEIGELADDKFRGVFRISYEGDACLTLKTKVQINTLSEYLSSSASFTSPDSLAASSPLTIPLQITLSDFKLSGFVILVFSRAKGITIVFRNDPLESLQVQSTFDSIPFIKDYLQEEIERQVRNLFQEDLPVAIYKLSLRIFNPDHATSLGLDTDARDSLATPRISRSPISSHENYLLNPLSASLDNSDLPRQFSETNLLRLKALMNSQNTLSLFTPAIPNVLYRGKPPSSILFDQKLVIDSTPSTPCTEPCLNNGPRPGIFPSNSSSSLNVSLPGRRKKKHRIVNLRNEKTHMFSPTSSERDDTATIASAPELMATTEKDLHRHMYPRPYAPRIPPGGIRCRYSEFAHINTASSDSANHTVGGPLQPAEDNSELSSCGNHTPEYQSTSLMQGPSRHVGMTAQRPRLVDIPRNPSGILEKAFMIRLVGELQRRADEDRPRNKETNPS
ncbi:hypothetical protein EDC01DRAFT_204358 [Geopyxis carbonaria]|nr:hypothetical protein EDC01DRAFT_204358 [Geopyxis carbonaria]